MRNIRRIGVVGAGTMGSQIAQQAALRGFSVVLHDADAAQVTRAVESNKSLLERRVQRGKLSAEDMSNALARVETVTDLSLVATDADFIIEAVVEDLDAKRQVFAELDARAASDVVLASNSSTIGISRIVEGLDGASRAVNMHFFHPALVMSLVEVMRGPQSAGWAVDAAADVAQRMGKEAVVIEREVTGLLVNRILAAIKREAFWLAEEGYATPQDIDRAVKLGLNHPMGPFELTDFSGLDVFYNASLQRYRETGDERDLPPRILEEKVRAGHLGRKTGKGFYEYGGE